MSLFSERTYLKHLWLPWQHVQTGPKVKLGPYFTGLVRPPSRWRCKHTLADSDAVSQHHRGWINIFNILQSNQNTRVKTPPVFLILMIIHSFTVWLHTSVFTCFMNKQWLYSVCCEVSIIYHLFCTFVHVYICKHSAAVW